MNSTVFAAYAAKPVSHAGLNEGRLLDTILEKGADKGHTDGLLNPEISKDVRTLVGMHDRGRIKSFEVKDTSYKALLSLAKYLDSILGAPRTDGLAPELLAQAVRFIKTVPAAQVFLRLEITDKKPDVPDYNPAHMCAYDADRSYGTDYLQIARRLTIHGSTSSVMNNTDLGTFLESGRKKCVVLYLGTQKNDDVQFLDPAHSLALDLVVGGIENYENLDALTEKVETLLNYPELIQLHEEVADLQILLTEFKNNLNIETGNDLVDRLTDLKNKIGHMSDNDELIDLLAPIAEMTSLMLGDELVHEILMLRDNMPETLAPIFPEIEDIHTALQSIINNPELSSEDRQSKIIALLQADLPDLLSNSDIPVDQVVTYLQHVQAMLDEKDITLTIPLIAPPQAWDYEHSERLAELLIYLQDPAQAPLIKLGLEKTPEGLEALKLLESLTEKLDLQNGFDDKLIDRIHSTLTSPDSETASLAGDLLRFINFASSPDIVAFLPIPLQFTLSNFVRDTLPAQLGLATSNISETLAKLSQGSVSVVFNPPHTLSEYSFPVALPFLATPPVIESLSKLPLEQLPQLIDALTNPTLKEQLQSNPKTTELVTALEALRSQDGTLPLDVSVRLAELVASSDPVLNTQAQKIIEALHIAATSPEAIAALPPEVQTLMAHVAEVAFATTNPHSPTASPVAPILDATQLPQLIEVLTNPALKEQLQSNPKTAELVTALEALRSQDGTLPLDVSVRLAELVSSSDTALTAQTQKIIEALHTAATSPEAIAALSPEVQTLMVHVAEAAFTATNRSSKILPEMVSAQKTIEHHLESLAKGTTPNFEKQCSPSNNSIATITQDILLGRTHNLSPNEQASLSIIIQQVKDHPAVLESLRPAERSLVVAAVTKNVIDRIIGNMTLPTPLQKEIKSALQSQSADRITHAINKAVNTFPPNRIPAEIKTLGIITSFLTPRSNKNPSEGHVPAGQRIPSPGTPLQQRPTDNRHADVLPKTNSPITSQKPRNDNIETPTSHAEQPTQEQKTEQKPAVCPVTGAEICLCDNFNRAAKDVKLGETLDIGNGITAKVIDVKVNEGGEEKKAFVVQDGERDIVTGTVEEVQNFFKKNDEEIEKDFLKRFGATPQRENPSPPPVAQPQTQPIIAIFDNINKPEENQNHISSQQLKEDIDIDFGEDIPSLKTSSSTFSPR
ncbi:MAG: hypothetical protein PHX61_03145 [Alphaproteobacteria bacterium]|nr:hypothetical protein [Alphaproteobacteria bacterium]